MLYFFISIRLTLHSFNHANRFASIVSLISSAVHHIKNTLRIFWGLPSRLEFVLLLYWMTQVIARQVIISWELSVLYLNRLSRNLYQEGEQFDIFDEDRCVRRFAKHYWMELGRYIVIFESLSLLCGLTLPLSSLVVNCHTGYFFFSLLIE